MIGLDGKGEGAGAGGCAVAGCCNGATFAATPAAALGAAPALGLALASSSGSTYGCDFRIGVATTGAVAAADLLTARHWRRLVCDGPLRMYVSVHNAHNKPANIYSKSTRRIFARRQWIWCVAGQAYVAGRQS